MRALAGFLFLIVGVAVSFVWGSYMRGDAGWIIGLLVVACLSFVAVLVHELGHAVAVWALGGRVKRIVALPFSLQLRPRRWSIAAWPKGSDLGGYVSYELNTIDRHRKTSLIAFAGPAANFLLSFVAGMLVGVFPSTSLPHHLLVALAILSTGMGLANLVPFRGSDGDVMLRAIRLRLERRVR